MKIHKIETGKVRIKANQMTRAEGIAPQMSKVLFGKKWSEWLPIYAWVIEHPEGIIVVDTGDTARTSEPGYFPAWHPYYAWAVDFDIAPEQEIGPQMRQLGIDPSRDVQKVILTHLHTDHAGGIHHFPNASIMIERNQFREASGITGIMAGYLPHRWPKWMKPELFTLPEAKYASFERSLPVTSDGKIRIVATPGHVKHHVSVVAEHEGVHYFLVGDTSYTQQHLLDLQPDGIGTKESLDTLQRIHRFAQSHPTVYLPAHDREAGNRLSEKQIVPVFDRVAESV